MSRADFARRMNIALGEARETHYWLRLVSEVEPPLQDKLKEIIQEADELVRILITIVKKTRQKEPQDKTRG